MHLTRKAVKRPFGKHTLTYKLFEKLFLETSAAELPLRVAAPTRGAAINLAMGLNRCQVSWAQESGVGDSFITRKALPRELPSGEWVVEVSAGNTRRNGDEARSSESWLAGVLGERREGKEERPSPPSFPAAEPAPTDSPMDEALARFGFLPNGKGGAA